ASSHSTRSTPRIGPPQRGGLGKRFRNVGNMEAGRGQRRPMAGGRPILDNRHTAAQRSELRAVGRQSFGMNCYWSTPRRIRLWMSTNPTAGPSIRMNLVAGGRLIQKQPGELVIDAVPSRVSAVE